MELTKESLVLEHFSHGESDLGARSPVLIVNTGLSAEA